MTSVAREFMSALAEYPDGLLGPTQVCLSCVKVLPIDSAAITVGLASDTWELLGASDETSARIEAQQAVTGEGPAIDALTRAGPVLVDDLAKQLASWPGFSAALGADAHGAMYALPLQIGAIVVGVLDLYRVEPLSLETEDMTAMLAVADIVTMVLLSHTPPLEVGSGAAEAWWVPSPASSEIHQATGMVVAQLAVPPRIAYLRLRAYAFAHDLPLTTVALDVIERRLRFNPDQER